VTSRRKESLEAIPPDFFLAGYADDVRAAADRLRAVVKRAVPDVIERVRPGWRIIGYDLPVRRHGAYFAWVMPEPVHVHLGFVHGVFMDDPERRLEGAHLRLVSTRFVTFEPGDDIPEPEMVELTRQAARIAALSREERFALMLDRDAAPDPVR
jgi:hypothetical protein